MVQMITETLRTMTLPGSGDLPRARSTEEKKCHLRAPGSRQNHYLIIV